MIVSDGIEVTSMINATLQFNDLLTLVQSRDVLHYDCSIPFIFDPITLFHQPMTILNVNKIDIFGLIWPHYCMGYG